MPSRSIEEVLATHTPELMAVPGVVGTGQGEEKGRPVIVVLVERASPQLRRRLPVELEGYRIIVRETGKVRALDQR